MRISNIFSLISSCNTIQVACAVLFFHAVFSLLKFFCLSVLKESVGGCCMQRICFKKGKMLDPSKSAPNQWETQRYWQEKKKSCLIQVYPYFL